MGKVARGKKYRENYVEREESEEQSETKEERKRSISHYT